MQGVFGSIGSSTVHEPDSHTRPPEQHIVAEHDRQMQSARLSVVGRLRIGVAGPSGHALVCARSINEPHTPNVPESTTRKQIPRQGDGAPIAGNVQRLPSGSAPGREPVAVHDPVRVSHSSPEGQSALLKQNGKQPGVSAIPPACVYQKPEHTWPGRHPGPGPGRHVCTQNEFSVGGSPIVMHVEPVPPHCICSVA